MSITTATELKTAIANWMHRSDLKERMDEFIALAEAGFNRDLRARAMEADFASVALVNNAATLPTDFLAFKELRFDGSPAYTITPAPIEYIRSKQPYTGSPVSFALTQSTVVCDGVGSIKGTYYKAIPTLTTNAANWLLSSHPGVYLFACLREANLYAQDAENANLCGQRAQMLLDDLQAAETANLTNGGPLVRRAR